MPVRESSRWPNGPPAGGERLPSWGVLADSQSAHGGLNNADGLRATQPDESDQAYETEDGSCPRQLMVWCHVRCRDCAEHEGAEDECGDAAQGGHEEKNQSACGLSYADGVPQPLSSLDRLKDRNHRRIPRQFTHASDKVHNAKPDPQGPDYESGSGGRCN